MAGSQNRAYGKNRPLELWVETRKYLNKAGNNISKHLV